ncbi:anti-sigma factor family protein [Desulfotomaculum copahuensis]|uniref:Anti-sigma-W factor RsiW n=1 Tax=Desulfotomaculum copahuensis TaxID=1838280 RepID=A0A1B7LCU5_9FIRM|nr:anti-sigma factor [Desulfotomaculum copahuensis]OAT80748.1 hypothetical protein A6M21_12935 [Desulfotomaculum copahuensis]
MNKHCDYWRELIPEYLDGELPARTAGEMARHLGSCPACRRELARWQSLFALLDLPEEEPAPALTAGIMAKLEESAPPSVYPGYRPAGALGLALCLLLALAAGFLGWLWAGAPVPALPKAIGVLFRILDDLWHSFAPGGFIHTGTGEAAGMLQGWAAVAGRVVWLFWAIGETLLVLARSLSAGIWLIMGALGLACGLMLNRAMRPGTR